VGRKRFYEMSVSEMQAYEQSEQYRVGRADAFSHGNPETVLEYWDREEPTYAELTTIVRNLLGRAS
jgi:hypothetical protein